MKNWLMLALVGLINLVSANSSYSENDDYNVLKEADPNAPDVQLVCRYRSASCQTMLEALVTTPSVTLTLRPLVLREAWRDEARLMLMANELGFSLEQHLKLAQRLNNSDTQIQTPEQKALLLAEQMPELDPEVIEAVTYSSELPKRLKQLNIQLKSYPISSVPTIIYQGRYTINATQGKTTRRILEIIEYLRSSSDAVSINR